MFVVCMCVLIVVDGVCCLWVIGGCRVALFVLLFFAWCR